MLSTLINRPCTIWSRTSSGDADELGDAIDAEQATVTVCELQQRQRTEQGELSDTGWLLILPAGTSIDTDDRVEVVGQVFEVIGAPWPARNPRTQAESHIEATLRRTAGAENGS